MNPRALLLSSSLLLLLACADADPTGDQEGGGGTGGPSENGGSGGAGGSGGQGGTGGEGGSGGQGGSGGGGGTGGQGETCWIDELPECEPAGPALTVDFPELWGVFAYFHGVEDFELPGFVVSHETGDAEDVLVVEGLERVRVTLKYQAGAGMRAPVEPGDAVGLHYSAFYDDLYDRQSHRQAVWLRDAAGRNLWGMDVHQNSQLPPQIHGLSADVLAPRCARTLDTGFGASRYGGSDLRVSYRGGPETPAPLGETTSVSGPVGAVELHVGGVFFRPEECHDGEFPRGAVGLAYRVTELAPTGAACTVAADCPADAYCERGAGGCGDAGHCAPRPSNCAMAYPVCGCDGNLYLGSCAANREGVDVAVGAACTGYQACGIFACREVDEACVRFQGTIPQCALVDCPAKDCSCFDGIGMYAGCTCTEHAPGRLEVICE